MSYINYLPYRALMLYGFGLVVVTTLPCLVALVIYAYYNDCDPKSAGKISRDDQVCTVDNKFSYRN